MKQTLVRVPEIECLYRSAESQIYYMIAKRNGRQTRKSLATTRLPEARRKLRIELGKLESADPVNVSDRPGSFNELLTRYIEIVVPTKDLKPKGVLDIEYRAKALRSHAEFLNKAVEKVSSIDCQQWFAKRRKMVGPSRVNTEKFLLRAVFDFAVENRWRPYNPAACLKSLKVVINEPAPPTRDEFLRLIATLRDFPRRDAADFVELMAYSGLRRNETAALTWGDIDFEKNLWRTAGKKRRDGEYDYVPLFPNMRRLLLDILASRGGPGKVSPTDRIMRIGQCKNSLETACENAKLPAYTHHDLRRFFTTEAVELGIDIRTVAAWARHKDNGALLMKRYAANRMEHSQELASQMVFDAKVVADKVVEMPKQESKSVA